MECGTFVLLRCPLDPCDGARISSSIAKPIIQMIIGSSETRKEGRRHRASRCPQLGATFRSFTPPKYAAPSSCTSSCWSTRLFVHPDVVSLVVRVSDGSKATFRDEHGLHLRDHIDRCQLVTCGRTSGERSRSDLSNRSFSSPDTELCDHRASSQWPTERSEASRSRRRDMQRRCRRLFTYFRLLLQRILRIALTESSNHSFLAPSCALQELLPDARILQNCLQSLRAPIDSATHSCDWSGLWMPKTSAYSNIHQPMYCRQLVYIGR